MLQLHMNVTIILQSYKKKTDMIKFTENNVPCPWNMRRYHYRTNSSK